MYSLKLGVQTNKKVVGDNMHHVVAVLQLFNILGSWFWNLLSNFHIVCIFIVFVNLIDRLENNFFRAFDALELFSIFYIIIWYYLKKRRNKTKYATPDINIKNKNTVKVINNDKEN
ncbi:hypothetical protein [Natranaerobius thermophilus]|uniref:Uncharacterized protein n=1 Tax=Natranaerobius thermophilus (strain ATCC BAA-1301 / DSM 18059 / JW/NM-WN-LF) TaxID=457570 RepID=B2A1D5_NATTJ|nr:hypothetical protein Nther_2510 [Natranaerobius thermophilus JW/NM-WN-LF]